jgi:hypothetical protein
MTIILSLNTNYLFIHFGFSPVSVSPNREELHVILFVYYDGRVHSSLNCRISFIILLKVPEKCILYSFISCFIYVSVVVLITYKFHDYIGILYNFSFTEVCDIIMTIVSICPSLSNFRQTGCICTKLVCKS